MAYQKIINLSDNTPIQPTRFRTNNWVEINDDARGTYNNNCLIEFKTSVLKSSLCDCSDAYVLICGAVTVTALAAGRGNNYKQVIFKNHTLFTDSISYINNAQVDNVKDIDVVIAMYNLIEYRNNYFKIIGKLWQYCRDESSLNKAGSVFDFTGVDDNSKLFKNKQKIASETYANDTKNVEAMVQLKYLSNFRRILEMSLIVCEINVIGKKRVTKSNTAGNRETTFAITDTKLFVPVVTLSTTM